MSYYYKQSYEGDNGSFTIDCPFAVIHSLCYTGNRNRGFWTEQSPGTLYLQGTSYDTKSISVVINVNTHKLTVSGIRSYGYNNGDPGHWVYISGEY